MLVDSCLRLSYMDPSHSEYTPEGALIIWPAGLRPNRNTTPAQIVNITGLVAARVGDSARISGAWSKYPRPAWWPAPRTPAGIVRNEVPDTATLAKELTAECPGPYWIVGDEVSALGSDEPLEISPPHSTIYFPRQKTLRVPIARWDAETEGRLILDGDCLRLQDDEVLPPYSIVVWPPGFTPHIERGEVQIRNGGGRTIARIGDNWYSVAPEGLGAYSAATVDAPLAPRGKPRALKTRVRAGPSDCGLSRCALSTGPWEIRSATGLRG